MWKIKAWDTYFLGTSSSGFNYILSELHLGQLFGKLFGPLKGLDPHIHQSHLPSLQVPELSVFQYRSASFKDW